MDHVMVDIETLGTDPGSVIVSIGAVRFGVWSEIRYGLTTSEVQEPNHFEVKGATDKEFYITIDVLNSLLAGLVTDSRTCSWWSGQSPEAIEALDNKDLHTPKELQCFHYGLREALVEFSKFVVGAKTIWAKGPDFDLTLLNAAYKVAGMRIPWNFRNARDVRTVLEIGKKFKAFEGEAMIFDGEKHNALSDARFQALQMIRVYETLGKEIS